MDDIFFYILVIIIIIIIIIVLYNYSKNIEKFNDMEFLNCHIFKKYNNDNETQDVIGYFPRGCRDTRNDKFKEEVLIPNNIGITGENGSAVLENININNQQKCVNCIPLVKPVKTKIENINKDGDITISPSINISNTIKTDEITFNRSGSLIINNTNISTLKELTKSYKKCQDNEYNNGIFSPTSIGECIECTTCPTGKYSTCGIDSEIGQCLVCNTTKCSDGQYLHGCEGKEEGTCVPKECTCNNGTGGTGADCNEDGKEHCISCEYGYKLNDNKCSKCTNTIPSNSSYINNSCDWDCIGDYDKVNENQCLKRCLAGYKSQGDICEPCGFDHYKEGENTNTECTKCYARGTTGDNKTATSEESCVPKVGYRKDGTDNFTLLPGHRESDTRGTILGCEFNYKRDSDTSECTECHTLLNGNYESGVFEQNCSNIICNNRYVINQNGDNCTLRTCDENYYLNQKGECIDINTYGDGIELNTQDGNLRLLQNYSWNGTQSTICPLGEKRDGNHIITHENFNDNINCTSCPSIEENKQYNREYDDDNDNDCMWECVRGYNKDGDRCLKVCSPGYKRNESTNTCEPCGVDHYKEGENTYVECLRCPINPTKHTTNGNTTAGDLSECLIQCGDGKYRNDSNNCTDCPINTYKNQTNTSETCTPCDDGYITNGLMGQTSCTLAQLQCSSDNQYYDETYCPPNSSYDYDIVGRYCTCNPGYEVNSTNDGCDAQPQSTLEEGGEDKECEDIDCDRCDNDDQYEDYYNYCCNKKC